MIIVSQSADPRIACLRVGAVDARVDGDCDFADDEPALNHVFEVDELKPDTLIEYELSDGVNLWRSSFRTLPLAGNSLRVGVVGDSGQTGPGQDGVVETLIGMEPHIVLHTGDSAYNFGFPLAYQWHFFDPFSALLASTGYYPAVGNHDCLPLFCFCEYYLDAFVLPSNSPTNDERNYSFDAGDAHFVSIDTVCSAFTEPVQEWLRQDLLATDRTWKIVYFHHPPFTIKGSHGPELWVRERLVPIFEETGVDLVLNGHEHMYERSYPIRAGRIRDAHQSPDHVHPDGIVYVITGGGGGGLYTPLAGDPEWELFAVQNSVHHAVSLTITPTRIEARAIDSEQNVFDRFSITKGNEEKPVFHLLAGDANGSGLVTISNGIGILQLLFFGRRNVCGAASDIDGSGDLTISDAIRILRHLFFGDSVNSAVGNCVARPDVDTTGCVRSCDP